MGIVLPTNFRDDVLAEQNPRRKYRMITNEDGTFSFEDVTTYQQMGSDLRAKLMNQITGKINENTELADNAQDSADNAQGDIDEIKRKTLKTLGEVKVATQSGYYVDALAVKELYGIQGLIKIPKEKFIEVAIIGDKTLYAYYISRKVDVIDNYVAEVSIPAHMSILTVIGSSSENEFSQGEIIEHWHSVIEKEKKETRIEIRKIIIELWVKMLVLGFIVE